MIISPCLLQSIKNAGILLQNRLSIINTFLESYDVSQKTIIPFCTSNSSEIDNSVAALSDTVTCKKWLKGYRFGADATEEDIRQLVNGSNL